MASKGVFLSWMKAWTLKVETIPRSEACSEPCQTSKMKLFAKKINGFQF